MAKCLVPRTMDVLPRRINGIVHGKRSVTADTDWRLCRFFGLLEGCWLRLQANDDIAKAKDSMAEVLSEIEPLPRDREAA